ncbi:MarR family 2-MHQ and catechol resistance regulon transcriptional repressor [Pullulanibacillus pueri]|uniref:MarR family transcriptional regulator n=1 Tax=Pullulanibacillus pueri TaxID=1437324 RepID=A0A8J2ZV77_9BACL|nr:MarR family transcriptional regulator [Pullulanibacillus pueri]MBM7681417.1 MarR family 2-MHQ and catechol resistance regulon transcriptional repressor [Pullulanibacillus pueri]GGH78794.1 MarR family transcriptional regulator [Pullulanibacillus pueri]
MVEQNEALSLKLFVILTRAHRTIADKVAKDIRSYGLNTTEFGVLELLYNKGEQPIQQIGGRVLLASGSMTYVIDKLEKKGYIRRRPCPDDRRVIYAGITEQGHELMETIFPKHQEVLTRLLEGVTDEEKQELMTLLKKMSFYAQKLE